jgi:photosystem II stability/assembly factor-like uncharacterized protein
MRAVIGVVALALLLGGCGGGEDDPPATRSERLVDFSLDPPYVNSLDVDPATGDFLLTTNRGFFRIDGEKVSRVEGTAASGGASAPVGTFLDVLAVGPGRLLGSGHPDAKGALPSFLGLLESDDGGRSWRSVSRLGEADFHKLVSAHDRLYGFDAVLSAMLISRDGGRRWVEHFTPPGLVIDFEVDPDDPDRIVAATEDRLVRSTDGARHWRPVDSGRGIRLAWPAADALYRAGEDGTVERSRDGGGTWERVGEVPREPYAFKALGAEELLLALSDGTIMRTEDGGRSWKAVFRP